MGTPSRVALFDSAFVNLRQMLDVIEASMNSMPTGLLSSTQIQTLLNDLPRIEEKRLSELGEKDSSCSICLTPYLTILTEEEMALAMDSPAHPVENMGVTKLSQPWQCGHMFCRRDISKWIVDGHDSCPMCRRLLLQVPEPTDTDVVREQEEHPVLTENLEAAMSQLRQLHTEADSEAVDEVMSRLFLDVNPMLRRTGGAEEENDDRREYSGMYS